MKRVWFGLGPIVLLLSVVVTAPVGAQMNPVDITGTIRGIDVRNKQVLIETADKKQYVADLNKERTFNNVRHPGFPEPRVNITGTAGIEVLRQGANVRFSVKLNSRKTNTEPITELTLFTPDPNSTTYGLSSNNLGGGDALGGLDDNQQAPRGRNDFPEGEYMVCGWITSIRNTSLSVTYPGEGQGRSETLKLKLDKNAKVQLDLSDPSLLVVGDEVQAKGQAPQIPGGVQQPRMFFFAIELTVKKNFAEEEKPARPKPDQPKEDQENAPAGENGEEAAPGGEAQPLEKGGTIIWLK